MATRIQRAGRRAVLRLLGSALAAIPFSALSSPVSRAHAVALPGSLGMLPLDTNLLRHAELRMRSVSGTRGAGEVVSSFFSDPYNETVIDRFILQVRSDMAAGRVANVDGWLVADTELALLASLRHSSLTDTPRWKASRRDDH